MEYTKRQQEILALLDVTDEPQEIVSPSGEVVILEPLGVALYDFINGCEALENYEDMNAAIDIFAGMYPEEYFLLLDWTHLLDKESLLEISNINLNQSKCDLN